MKTRIITSITLVCLCLGATAQIIHVPGDQESIQAGILAASDGDTVLVADSIYYENINFMGKAITVASHFLIDGDTNHISNTVIDGSQPWNPDNGSVVTFNGGEDTLSVLCGFTITGGTGTFLIDPVVGELRYGGGIALFNSGARIDHNYIEFNSVSYPGLVDGGGISAGDTESTSWVILSNNKIRNNQVSSSAPPDYGWACGSGGASLYCNAIIRNNEITHNSIIAGNIQGAGAGLLCVSQHEISRQIIVEGNLITYNHGITNGIESQILGGGIRLIGSYSGVIRDNVVSRNSLSSPYLAAGAGMLITMTDSTLTVENNIVDHNLCYGGPSWGGGITVNNGHTFLIGNLLYKNRAELGGGVLIVNSEGCTKLINNTIIADTADTGGGLFLWDNACAEMVNSILWNNEAGEAPEIHVESGSLSVSYSNIEGGWPGVGNLDTFPSFTDLDADDYALWDDSPCIDAGDPGSDQMGLPNHDLAGEMRFLDGNMDGDTIIDMGAFEYRPVVNSSNNAISIPCLSDQCVKIIPNPVRETGTMEFTVEREGVATLVITDISGRKMKLLCNEKLLPGTYRMTFDATELPAGVYFYRLTTMDDGMATTGKMIKF